MAKFMILYRSSTSATEQMANADTEQMQAGMALWATWAQKAAGAIVDLGTPLGAGRVLPRGASTTATGQIGGFSILQGRSLDEVTALLEDHPHFHSPDASIEVLEFLSMPGMEG